MTSPPQNVQVTCPKCGHIYEDWYRPSINLGLDNFDDEYLERATTATCPLCQFKVSFGVLIVGAQGHWMFNPAAAGEPGQKTEGEANPAAGGAEKEGV